MLKEIQPVDLFEIADQSLPPNFNEHEWERLAGPIYGATRRGLSALDIWRAVLPELDNKAEVFLPYLAQLIVSIYNRVAPFGKEMTPNQLARAA